MPLPLRWKAAQAHPGLGGYSGTLDDPRQNWAILGGKTVFAKGQP